MQIITSIQPERWRVVTTTVAGGGSVEVDAVPLSVYAPTKYYVEMKSNSEGVYKSFELLGMRLSSTDVSDTLYAKMGSQINTSAVLGVYAGVVKLILTNNETYPLSVRVTKLVN